MNESTTIFSPGLTRRVLQMSLMLGRSSSMILDADLTTLFGADLSSAEQLPPHTVIEKVGILSSPIQLKHPSLGHYIFKS